MASPRSPPGKFHKGYHDFIDLFDQNVDSFDQYVILLKNTVTQMVYKHAVSTIVPSKAVVLATDEAN